MKIHFTEHYCNRIELIVNRLATEAAADDKDTWIVCQFSRRSQRGVALSRNGDTVSACLIMPCTSANTSGLGDTRYESLHWWRSREAHTRWGLTAATSELLLDLIGRCKPRRNVEEATLDELRLFARELQCFCYFDPPSDDADSDIDCVDFWDPDKDINGGDLVDFVAGRLERLGLAPTSPEEEGEADS